MIKKICDFASSQILDLFMLSSLADKEAICSTLVSPFATDGLVISSMSFLSRQVERVEKNDSNP